MPVFEFVCKECGGEFEELTRRRDDFSDIRCPFCKTPSIEQKISLFGFKSSSRFKGTGKGGGDSCSSCSSTSCSTC